METQAEWRPVILAAARALSQQTEPRTPHSRHFHWDWTRKEAELKLLAVKFYGLAHEGKLQGIMKLRPWALLQASRATREAAGVHRLRRVSALEYQETHDGARQPQRFRAVGTRLFEAAVLQSQEEGFREGLACILFLVRKAFTSTVRHDAGRP